MDLTSDNSAVFPGTNSSRTALQLAYFGLRHVSSSAVVSQSHRSYLTALASCQLFVCLFVCLCVCTVYMDRERNPVLRRKILLRSSNEVIWDGLDTKHAWERNTARTNILVEIAFGRRQLEDPGIDGRLLLKWNEKNRIDVGVDWIHLD
jgi:hypothetical protein